MVSWKVVYSWEHIKGGLAGRSKLGNGIFIHTYTRWQLYYHGDGCHDDGEMVVMTHLSFVAIWIWKEIK